MSKGLHAWLLLVCALALLLPLSGCGSGQGGANRGGEYTEGTLTLYGVSPTTLDPAVAREGDSLEYIVEIFSGLVCFDPDLNLIPDIADRWEGSSDGRVYTFYLRDDARFHDGKKVTAHDFKYALERACAPETGSRTAETYLGDIVGVKERLAGDSDEISGVNVLGDRVLQITIDAPKAYFLSKLAHPVAFVVDRENVESDANWWKSPNGTGPFRLGEWREDEAIVLERNDSYYQEEPIRLKQVVYRLWAGVPMRMYELGQIDVTDVYLGDIERVMDLSNPLNRDLHVTPGFALYYVGFNCAEAPFDDPKVRRAFCYAVDRQKIVDLVLKGVVKKASGILPPDMPAYNAYVKGLEYDVEKARQLIRESTYGDVSNLPPIALTSSGWGDASDLEAALVDQWRRNLGVEVEIRLWQPEAYPYIVMDEKDEMFTLGWAADYPDPQNFLDVLFHTGREDNIGEFSDPKVDIWLEEGGVEEDSTARMIKYRLAEQEIVDKAACLPLYFDVSYTLVKPYVKDLPLTPFWIPRLRYVAIEPH